MFSANKRRGDARKMSQDDSSTSRGSGNFNALREELNSIKQEIKRLYKLSSTYEDKRDSLKTELELLKRANKEYEDKVKDLLDVFRKCPPSRVSSATGINRQSSERPAVPHQVYRSQSPTLSDSRSSSRSGLRVLDDDDDSFDDDYVKDKDTKTYYDDDEDYNSQTD